jgi:hypothetical protein
LRPSTTQNLQPFNCYKQKTSFCLTIFIKKTKSSWEQCFVGISCHSLVLHGIFFLDLYVYYFTRYLLVKKLINKWIALAVGLVERSTSPQMKDNKKTFHVCTVRAKNIHIIIVNKQFEKKGLVNKLNISAPGWRIGTIFFSYKSIRFKEHFETTWVLIRPAKLEISWKTRKVVLPIS